MKPSLDRTVYCIYGESILVEKVYAIGKESFFICSTDSDTLPDSWEWWYENYNVDWFTSLAKAKAQLIQNGVECYSEVGKVKKVADDYYELVFE